MSKVTQAVLLRNGDVLVVGIDDAGQYEEKVAPNDDDYREWLAYARRVQQSMASDAKQGWSGSLTARQLLVILLIVGFDVWGVLSLIH